MPGIAGLLKKNILHKLWPIFTKGFSFTHESRLLKGKTWNEDVVGGNDGCHICLGSGSDISVASSGEGGCGTGPR